MKVRAPVRPKTIVGVSVLSVGVAAAGVGGNFIYDAVSFKQSSLDPSYATYTTAPADYDRTPPFADLSETDKQSYFEGLWDAYQANLTSFKTMSFLGFGLAGGGLLAVAAGVAILAIPAADVEPSDAVEVSAMVLPTAAGASVGVRIRY